MKWLAPFLFAVVLSAQTRFPHHNITLNAGGATGLNDLAASTEPSALFGINYGYRFHTNLQADVGFDTIMGAARVNDYYESYSGTYRIKDRQYFVPMGLRAILPMARGRVLAYGGGGGAYMRYSEVINQPSEYYRIDCPVCSSRSGWGYYAQAGVDVFLDRAHMFRLGVGSRMYKGHTDGLSIGNLPAWRTDDRWVTGLVSFGFSF